ncbi:MAG: hypothetical protein FWE09_09700, partial [Treponema sp.]|nr:hypothetical protein [Treponema sp.]
MQDSSKLDAPSRSEDPFRREGAGIFGFGLFAFAPGNPAFLLPAKDFPDQVIFEKGGVPYISLAAQGGPGPNLDEGFARLV